MQLTSQLRTRLEDMIARSSTSLDVVKSKSRIEDHVNVRCIVAYWLYHHINFNYAQVGAFLERDHTSAMYLVGRYIDRIATDTRLQEENKRMIP